MADKTFGDLLSRVEKIVENYRITIEKNGKNGFKGSSLELPEFSATGKTVKKCYEATKRTLITEVTMMIRSGKNPPEPISARKRTKQVNIRLTPFEKILLAEAASKEGFDGPSDYVRHVVLERIHQGS